MNFKDHYRVTYGSLVMHIWLSGPKINFNLLFWKAKFRKTVAGLLTSTSTASFRLKSNASPSGPEISFRRTSGNMCVPM
jgi:hypothetical protein